MIRQTEVLAVDPDHPAPAVIGRAADVLRAGGLVAFPTETVYGLGANALDAQAVQGIFTAKGRPAKNPLIVHIGDVSAVRELASAWPLVAQTLADRFWPGPLSMVLPKTERVPEIVTAGAKTVALRVPAHPVARALIEAARLPIAAPSANRSNRLSPTRAQHVLKDLQGRIDLVLDAGPTSGGLESTVLDLTVQPPRLLRPGLVSQTEIEELIGPIDRHDAAVSKGAESLPSPGMLARHYAPRAPLECLTEGAAARVAQLRREGVLVGWLCLDEDTATPEDDLTIRMPSNPIRYAAQLYAVLHALDELGAQRIVVELPPTSDAWFAVHDRLRRGSA